MQNSVHENFEDWERLALLELHNEYAAILRERRLKLRPARLELSDAAVFWGQWNSSTRVIFLTRRLLREHSWFRVLAVLRHEIAHQYVDEVLGGERGGPHGERFQEACRKLGVPPEFMRATVHLTQSSLDWREASADDVSEKMLERVRKLLNLASSSNEHEALLAMNRVREIYAKYNLERTVLEEPRYFHLIISTGKKRLTTVEQKIVGILVGHFFVQVIVGREYKIAAKTHQRSIEIIGTRENVLLAEYIYYFLLRHSKQLTDDFVGKKKLLLHARRSYHLGLLEGFDEKLRRDPAVETPLISKALEVFRADRRLDSYVSEVYPRLVSLSSRARLGDGSAFAEGKREGRRITLNKPIHERASGPIKRLLGR